MNPVQNREQNPLVGRPRAVVVVPTYDERENIALIIPEILKQQASIADFELHVLVSDSHSQDGTLDIVRNFAELNPRVHLIDVQKRGIGVGLYQGFMYAITILQAEVLIQMDADFQHNPDDIPTLLLGISQGYDLTVGSRFIEGSENHTVWYRRILSVSANWLILRLLGIKGVTEVTTSYRSFTREMFLKTQSDSIPWEEESFIAVPVALVAMIKQGARCKEVPMTMNSRLYGYSKLHYGRYIRDILSFSLRAWLSKRKS